jgi:ERF superfamily
MTPAHIPALRLVLRDMLADVTYAEAEKSAPFVEARLAEAGWPEQTRTQLKVLALRWVSTQRADVQVAMRKALGEEISEHEAMVLPSHARRGSTRHQLTTTLEGVAMSTIATTLHDDKRTLVRPEDGPVSELFGDVLEERLQRVEDDMRKPPYWFPDDQERLTKAIARIREGKVSRDAFGIYHVTGSKKTIYDIDTECPCPQGQKGKSKWCYHLVATAAYRKLHADFPTEAPSLFPKEKTVDERLATIPLESPQDGSGDEITFEDDSQDAPPPLEAHSAPDEGLPVAVAVPPTQEIPTLGPCAFVAQDRIERSATVSRLMVALARAQHAMQNPACDTNNPHFRSRYASLAAVRDAVTPALTAQGIALTQLVSTEDNTVLCTTGLWHASGEYLCSTLRLPVTKADAQGYGSALTYARRYALMGICNVAGDDDDDGERLRDTGSRASTTSPPPSGDLRADIWKLLQGQGFRGQRDEARTRVLELTGLELEPENYAVIVARLTQAKPVVADAH